MEQSEWVGRVVFISMVKKGLSEEIGAQISMDRPPQLIGMNSRDCLRPPQCCTEEEGRALSAPDWFQLLSSALIGAKLRWLH